MTSQVIKEFFNPPKIGKGNGTPLAPIPSILTLRDGRQFNVGDLFRQVEKPTNIRLNTEISRRMSGYQRVAKKSLTRRRLAIPNRKYTYEERVWLCTATDSQISSKYNIDAKAAMRLRAQSTYICKNPDFHRGR